MNNIEIVNVVADIAFVVIHGAIVASRLALRYFDRLLLRRAERFFSTLREAFKRAFSCYPPRRPM